MSCRYLQRIQKNGVRKLERSACLLPSVSFSSSVQRRLHTLEAWLLKSVAQCKAILWLNRHCSIADIQPSPVQWAVATTELNR